ncbi:MAG TPA: bifunctional serine/threonine-protein kinase/formylglycine-generating enzyme family protein [Kofleriaceae bacterium]|nr:bifunctional serine/threonine-protein kinase/formylglycine-generating enzyme family protein [Kofleriaceae bacterium]
MRFEEHIAVATESLRRGLIDRRTMREAVKALMAPGAALRDEALWIENGWLSGTDLHEILGALRAANPPPPESEQISTGGSQHSAVDTTLERRANAIAARRRRKPDTRDSDLAVGETMAGDDLTPLSAVADMKRALGFRDWQQVGAERYIKLESLGRGGLGEVVRADDPLLGRSVAIKYSRPERGAAAHAIIEHEARIIASLEHPNIVPAYDAGYSAELGPYYVMRVLTQTSLEEVLLRLRAGDAATAAEFGQKLLLRQFIQVCNAAEYAHQRGVIHCDLKPENILLGEYGEVLIVDWGLAWSATEKRGPRGGTPGYMAPEQFIPDETPIDARTDVFALGATLYRIVALVSAFPEARTATSEARSGLMDVYRGLIPPGQRAPDRHVPPELDEICMRALRLSPAERYPSARALAADVEAFLEGRKELERRTQEADRCAENGEDLAARYHESVEARPMLVAAVHAARRATPPWAPSEEKEELWDAEDVLRVTDSLRRRMFRAAVAAYEQALELAPAHTEARLGIARLYRAELERARRERDELDIVHFTRLLRVHDESFGAANANGLLRIRFRRAGLSTTVYRLTSSDRRFDYHTLCSHEATAATLPPVDEQLAPGFYILRVTSSEYAPASYPIAIEAGQETLIDVRPPRADVIREGEVYVPGGLAYLGAGGVDGAREPFEAHVPAFAIGRLPVTFREYLRFVSAVRATEPERAARLLPRTVLDHPRWSQRQDAWAATGFADERGDDELLELPVFGISCDDASAYAAWLSKTTGLEYRLPTDSEWEKAGRGTDGRLYPWGNQFDATFCKMRFSKAGRSYPERSGLYDADVSPYGVRDMAGNIADWVLPDGDTVTYQSDQHRVAFSRGGAWCDWEEECRLTTRREYLAIEVTSRVGFRLARSIPEENDE